MSNIKDISLKNSSFLFRIGFFSNILSLTLKLKGIEFINSILFFLNQFIISKVGMFGFVRIIVLDL
jgi:hypothetical protein